MLCQVADLARTAGGLRWVTARSGIVIAVTNGDGHLRSGRDLVASAVADSDPGWRMLDPAARTFSLESAADQLAAAFPWVEVVRPDNAGQVVVHGANGDHRLPR